MPTVATSVAAQEGLSAGRRSKPAFTVTLDVDATTVRQRDPISFLVLLRSGESANWFVHVPVQEGLGGDFAFDIRDIASQKQVAPRVWHHAQQSATPVLALCPNGTILGGESRDTVENYGMLPGHTYQVTAVYRSPVAKKVLHGIPVLSSIDGQLRSNVVQLQVRP